MIEGECLREVQKTSQNKFEIEATTNSNLVPKKESKVILRAPIINRCNPGEALDRRGVCRRVLS